MLLLYDCPECINWGTVKLWVSIPAIWRCEKCGFLFERCELVRHVHDPDF